MTMSQHQTFNEASKQHFPKQRNKRKAHLEVHVGMWSIGLGVLKEPFFIIPFKWWMIFLSIKSKKRRPIGRGWQCCAKKRGVWKWVSQKWVCSKNAEKHKDMKKYWRGWVKGSWEVEKSVFLETKWGDEEENARWRGEWIVSMVERRKEGRRKQKK